MSPVEEQKETAMGKLLRLPRDLKVIDAEEAKAKENRKELVSTVAALFVVIILLITIFSVYANSHTPEKTILYGKGVVRK